MSCQRGLASTRRQLSHRRLISSPKAERACKTQGQQCDTANALRYKDALSDRLLANAVATCTEDDCNTVATFIRQEMARVGCASPYACTDQNTLQGYWAVAQQKAQGLVAVYPESWLIDAKVALDLARLGVRLAASAGGKGSLEALSELGAKSTEAIKNNIYTDGAFPARWTKGPTSSTEENFLMHWNKHPSEFPELSSANDYYRLATELADAERTDTLAKIGRNGDRLLYQPRTNTFVVTTKSGEIKTMFRPDPSTHGYPTNLDFWNSRQ